MQSMHDDRYEFEVRNDGSGFKLGLHGPQISAQRAGPWLIVELGDATLETLLDLEIAVRDGINRELRARHISRDEALLKAFIEEAESDGIEGL